MDDNQKYIAPQTETKDRETYSTVPDKIGDREREQINKCRQITAGQQDEPETGTSADLNGSLVGLALSGGGIRSSTFSLGVMQALAKAGLLKYVDYLSTVSGGGYIGSSYTWLTSPNGDPVQLSTSDNGFPYGTELHDDPDDALKDPNTDSEKMLRYLRDHGNYLSPGADDDDNWLRKRFKITILSGVGVLIRGAFLNLLVCLPLLASLWIIVDDVIEWPWVSYFICKVAGNNSVIAQYLLIGIAILFLVISIFYSWATFLPGRGGKHRYVVRRLFEKSVRTLIILMVIVGFVLWLPTIVEWGSNLIAESATHYKINGLSVSLNSAAYLISNGSWGLIVVGAVLAYFAFKKSSLPSFVTNLLINLAILFVLFGLLALSLELAQWVMDGKTPRSGILPEDIGRETRRDLFHALILISVVTGWFVNVNYISLHRYYRDRLMEAFMPNVASALKNNTGAARKSNKGRLSSLLNENGPYHIVNTNLIQVDSTDERIKSRGGSNFILSPLFCGSNITGWRATKDFMGDRLTMATSIAISGAAANPNAGVGGTGLTIQKLVGLLMSILGIRLGNWVPNPMYSDYQLAKPNHFRPGMYEILHLLGQRGYHSKRAFLEISDGGHFENTGIYELVRRKVKLIIVCDGGAEPNFSFGDFQNVKNRVRQDFGAEIGISSDELGRLVPRREHGFPKGTKVADTGFLTGTITYNDGSVGTLVYLKTTMVEGLGISTLNYNGVHPDFPDETTAEWSGRK